MKNKAYYRLKNISHSDPIYQACSKNKKETTNLENTKKGVDLFRQLPEEKGQKNKQRQTQNYIEN
jgi:uncharacterized protein YbaP (TraB family)